MSGILVRIPRLPVGCHFMPINNAIGMVLVEGLLFLALEMLRSFDHYSTGL
jgi:hypothetical protein